MLLCMDIWLHCLTLYEMLILCQYKVQLKVFPKDQACTSEIQSFCLVIENVVPWVALLSHCCLTS